MIYELNFNGISNHSILQIQMDKSYFILNKDMGENEQKKDINENIDGVYFNGDIKDKVGSVYINNYSDSLLYSREIDFTAVNYIYEKKDELKWILLDSTKNVGDYHCRYAQSKFRGRVYNVWYTTDIPFQTGPWKLIGLPGLILYAADSSQEVIFQAKRIKELSGNIISIDIPKEKLISFEECFINRNKKLKELQKRIVSKAPKGFNVSVKSINASYIETDF